jgi:hypothetical protein
VADDYEFSPSVRLSFVEADHDFRLYDEDLDALIRLIEGEIESVCSATTVEHRLHPRLSLARDARRAALHQVLHLGLRRHRRVARRGHGECAVRRTVFHRQFGVALFHEAIHQPRGE